MPVIRTPKGFNISVAAAGIKSPGRNDMALIYTERPATIAASFTTSKVKAAPILLDMVNARQGRAHAVVVNSGNANACTGRQGMLDARETAVLTARGLGVPENSVLVSSTGVIGVPMPMKRVRTGINDLIGGLGDEKGPEDAAKAIMTTDTFHKVVDRKLTLGGKRGSIVGIAKGAGMIEPNMATMLCYILTDFRLDRASLKNAFNESVEMSFNRITVDGDRSTSDTAIVMANGAVGNEPLTYGSDAFGTFATALREITYELSRLIVKDGEGASKVIEVCVTGARSEKFALRAARAIANSLLFKTAMYGGDPNWGRIMAILGRADAPFKEERVDISLGSVMVVNGGLDTGKLKAAEKELHKPEVKVTVNLNIGEFTASVLTCDLTETYIKINSEYTT
ncbi:bifunctional glutamate N-acetyltransferase/amino-acid acetyltransferase ArgJ [Nitrospirota bacterium]